MNRNVMTKRFGILSGALLATVVGFSNLVQAQTRCVWTNTSAVTTTPWSNSGNWTNNAPIAGGGSDYGIVFNAGAGGHCSSNDFSGSFQLNRLEFKSGTMTLYGNELMFTGSGSMLTNYSAASTTIYNNIALADNLVIAAPNNIYAYGSINLNSKVMTLSPGNISLFGKLTGTGGSINIGGIGTWLFGNSACDFTGGITAGGTGELQVKESSTGSASDGNLTKGPFGTGTLVLSGNSVRTAGAASRTVGNAVTLSANTVFPSASANTLTLTGPVTLNGSYILTVSIAPPDSLTLAGAIGDGGNGYGLAKAGVGKLVLMRANTYSGDTVMSAGTLVLTNQLALQNSTLNYTNGAVQFASGITAYTLGGLAGSVTAVNIGLTNAAGAAIALSVGNNTSNTTYSGALSAGGSLIKVGTGTLTLSGANTYGGLTTVSNGTLAVGRDNALADNNALTLSGGTFDAGSFSNALGTLSLTTGMTNMIAVNSGTCRLSFTNMSASTGWLSVTGTLGAATLRFGTDANGLTSDQRKQIKANGRNVYLDAQGYLQPIPYGTMIRFF